MVKIMRDTIKDKKYFDNFISEDSKRIINFIDKLKAGQVPANRIERIKELIFSLELGVFIAKYSRGDDLKSLYDSFCELFDKWIESFNKDNYDTNLKMISLSFLDKLEDKLSQIDDWLTTFIISGENNKKLIYPDHYMPLNAAIKNNDFTALINYAEDIWFDEELDCFVSHKSAENIYYGYWSFEVAAIIKKLRINDSTLKGTKYYPYDLAHF